LAGVLDIDLEGLVIVTESFLRMRHGKLRNLVLASTMIGLLGCVKQDCNEKLKLVFRQRTTVMEKPYPQWYKGVNNRIVTTVNAGQSLPVCTFTPSKDFGVYKVRLPDGSMGYVEYDPNIGKEVTNDQARPIR
jgi:hypothetical protein